MIVGIDLGTTNSLIGAFEEGAARLFANALGAVLTPSAVSLDDEGRVIVGQAARDRLVSHPEHSAANFKRWMGSSREIRLGTRSFRPEELSALVLRSLVADAEAATGEKVEEAVISVPAYFSDAQRRATRHAGQLAGLRVQKLVNEPTAAALAYGITERPDNSRFLVFDLGGGTFDVSILEMFDGVVEVHASAGDNYLGGEDFVSVLEQALLDAHQLRLEALEPRDRARLRRALEDTKRALSSSPEADLQFRLGERELAWSIDQATFERLCAPLMQRMRVPLERALRDAGLRADDLDEIVLVGGASRMPLVARMVSRMFGKLPLRHVDPDQAVARGAAIAAGLKARDAALDEVILTDVCPYSLGVEVARSDPQSGLQLQGVFAPIIHRNSTVPVSREESFVPTHERQRQIDIRVFQGESPMTEHNILLGELHIDLPSDAAPEEKEVDVRFTYDINGVLQVETRLRGNGARQELLLMQNGSGLDEAEVRQRLAALADLKVHPRNRQENIATLARAERLYAEHLELREQIDEWIARFRGAIESQDNSRIRVEREQFNRALDEVEAPL